MKKIMVLLVFAGIFLLSACVSKARDSRVGGASSYNTTSFISKEMETEILSMEATEAVPKQIELNIPVGNDFTIVEATYSTKQYYDNTVAVKLKIKNNTDENFQMVLFQFYAYDKNGDRCGAHCLSIPDMEALQATWTFNISTKLDINDFGSIKIDYYALQEWIGENTVTTVEKVSLSPKPVVYFEQMTEKD